jgi:hypothetical protein
VIGCNITNKICRSLAVFLPEASRNLGFPQQIIVVIGDFFPDVPEHPPSAAIDSLSPD